MPSFKETHSKFVRETLQTFLCSFFTSDSYNPEQPQFDRTPVWMRLGNGRPPHPLPARGGFHPMMALRSRELLPVTPNQTQLTVRGN